MNTKKPDLSIIRENEFAGMIRLVVSCCEIVSTFKILHSK